MILVQGLVIAETTLAEKVTVSGITLVVIVVVVVAVVVEVKTTTLTPLKTTTCRLGISW
jgi:hypothetical protein